MLRVRELNWSLSLSYMMGLCNIRKRFSTFLQLNKYFSLGEQSLLNQCLSRAASTVIVSSPAMLPSSVSLIWELLLCPKPGLIFSVSLSWIKGLHIPSVVCSPAAFEIHWIFYIGHNYSMNEEGELQRRMIRVGWVGNQVNSLELIILMRKMDWNPMVFSSCHKIAELASRSTLCQDLEFMGNSEVLFNIRLSQNIMTISACPWLSIQDLFHTLSLSTFSQMCSHSSC